jgi:Ran GTPase-activating protein (RanGAP) involved in mRNA processing and transport
MNPDIAVSTLNLAYNPIGVGNYLASIPRPNTLTSLNLAHCSIGAEGAVKLAQALKISSLYYCNLRNNEIGDSGMEAIAKAFGNFNVHVGTNFSAENNTVASIDLQENLITGIGASFFADTLKKNATITYLNLNKNQFAVEGALAMASALATNKSLSELHLMYNRIGKLGARTFTNLFLRAQRSRFFSKRTKNQQHSSNSLSLGQ